MMCTDQKKIKYTSNDISYLVERIKERNYFV